MTWVHLTLAIPIALLMVALVHDFFSGLDEQRLWSDPAVEDPQSFQYRSAAAPRQGSEPVIQTEVGSWKMAG